MLTDAQLEEQKTGIGGSEAATVLGINPFKTAFQLYLEKRGEAPPEDPEFLKQSRYWGSKLEEPVREAYAEETGYKVQRVNKLMRSKEHPFMIAFLDGRVVGEDRRIGYEGKTAVRADGWGESGSNEVPAYIMCQCQHYLAVTNYDLWDLAVLIGNRDFRLYRIAPIDEIIEQVVTAEETFWDRVEAGVPPEPDWQASSMTRLIKNMYKGTDGTVIELPAVAEHYHKALEDARKQRDLYNGIVDGCRNHLAMMMKEAAFGLLPDGTVYTRKRIVRSSYSVGETEYTMMRHVKKVPAEAERAIESGRLIQADAEE